MRHFDFFAVDGHGVELNIRAVEHMETVLEVARKVSDFRKQRFFLFGQDVFFVFRKAFKTITVIRKLGLFGQRKKFFFRAFANFRFRKCGDGAESYCQHFGFCVHFLIFFYPEILMIAHRRITINLDKVNRDFVLLFQKFQKDVVVSEFSFVFLQRRCFF